MKKQGFAASLSVVLLSALILVSPQLVQANNVTENSPVIADTSPPGSDVINTEQTDTDGQTEKDNTASQAVGSEDSQAQESGGLSSSEGTSVSTTEPASDTVILHTNDIHGRMAAEDGVIGMPAVGSLIEEERSKANQTTLVLDAGDAFQGLPISNTSKGEEMAKAMNAAGYDAMAVGNHEFDFGLEQIQVYKEKLTFPLLSANTYVNGARLFEPATVTDKNKAITGDEAVVIGVTSPETATKTHPSNIIGVAFEDPISEVKKVIEQTEATAAASGMTYNKYIILAHLGIDASTPAEWRGDTLAQALADYAPLTGKTVIIIDGHSHTVHSASFGSNVTYNQTGSYLNHLGKITIAKNGRVTPELIAAAKTTTVPPKAEISAIVSNAQASFEAANATVIVANNPVELNGERSNIRVRETNSGNAIADAIYNYGQTGFSTPTDLAVTNGGGIRATIPANQPITRGKIISTLPFGNMVSQIQVKGSQIREMFEKSLGSAVQTDNNGTAVLDENGLPLLSASGGFFHISGARVYFDPTAPAGSRILTIEILDQNTNSYRPLEADRNYALATNDFLAAGGDGYTMLGGPREEGPSIDTVFADYLASLTDMSAYSVITSYTRTIPLNPATSSNAGSTNLQDPVINNTIGSDFNPEYAEVKPTASVHSLSSQSSQALTAQSVSSLAWGNLGQIEQSSSRKSTDKQQELLLPQTGEEYSLLFIYGIGLLLLTGRQLTYTLARLNKHL